jgi:transposase
MKDGRTHLAHKAEHAIDLDTGAIVGVTVQGADEGDTATIQETLPEAAEQLEAIAAVTNDTVAVIEEVVADKGYHSRHIVHDLETLDVRTYISEPDRGPQTWTDQEAERNAVYANRRRIRGNRGKRLLRKRGELLERARARERAQAAARSCRRLQSRPLDPDALRRRYATRPPGTLGSDRHDAQRLVDVH